MCLKVLFSKSLRVSLRLILEKGAPVRCALPIGCVLTLPATGSEVKGNAVISRRERGQELAYSTPLGPLPPIGCLVLPAASAHSPFLFTETYPVQFQSLNPTRIRGSSLPPPPHHGRAKR